MAIPRTESGEVTKLGFLGLGEAGSLIAKGLGGAGLAGIAAYDIVIREPAQAARLRTRAEAAGVALVESPAALAGGAEIVISAVTADQSLIAADSIAPHLGPRHLYVDINSTAPATKEAAARIVEAFGARYVEAAVMDAVAKSGHKAPMLLGGKGAADFASALTPYGMRLEVLGEAVGPASATKMFRSILIKGLEALILESLLASSRYGVAERVFRSVGESFPGLDWNQLAHYLMGRTAVHGARRAHEMEEVAATLEAMGIAPIMAEAAARRIQWGVEQGLPRKFAARIPERYEEVIRALGEER